jgi:hypothetical protein
MKTAEVLRQRLEMIYRWHGGMVNPDTGMLEYLYFPQTDAFVRERCSIREIASVWDVERVSHFLNRREPFPLVEKSLRHYDDYLVEREGFLILDPGRLAEPSSIAHSAFMILAPTGAPAPRKIRRITALADGLLRQQRPEGSYKATFTNCRIKERNSTPARPCSLCWKPIGRRLMRGASKAAQRIDGAGHAASAFIKSAQNGIECDE